MGRIIKSVGYQATAPGSSGAAASAFTGDTLTVLNASPGSRISLIEWAAFNQGAGWHQLTHPSGHDVTRGMRAVVPAGAGRRLMPWGTEEPMVSQEIMSLTIAGSATAGQIELGIITIDYEDAPGLDGRFIAPHELWSRVEKLTTVQASIDTGTAGGWSGSEPINAESDLLKANRDYAVLGIATTTAGNAIGITAPDWSNTRIAVPSPFDNAFDPRSYFILLSDWTGRPCIPVFNSANRSNVLIDASGNQADWNPVVSIHLALLKQ
jgi:hypothetical protein